MKKSIFSYFSYLVLTLLAVGTLSSCDPTTEGVDAAPTITINPTNAEIEVGQTADFTYTVVSTKNLEEIRIISRNVTQQTITTFTNNDSHNGSFSFLAAAADAGTTITVTIEAVDKDANRSSQSVDIKIKEATVVPDPIAIDAFPAVLLGAQGATTGSFLDANTGTVYTIANAKANSAKVDMAYLQGGATAAQGAVIGSPVDNSIAFVFDNATSGVQTWATKNATRFKDTALSEANFNAIGTGEGQKLIDAFAAGTQPDNDGVTNEGAKSRVNKLTAGKVFAFQTAGGKTGLVHIVSVDAGETGSIRLNVKVVR